MPGPTAPAPLMGSSNTIFTGTRWTTFTKLPTAFFRRQQAEARAAAGLDAVHVPVKRSSRERFQFRFSQADPPQVRQLRFLEIGGDQTSFGHNRNNVCPDCT